MSTLSAELRGVLTRRIERADSGEILAITAALSAIEDMEVEKRPRDVRPERVGAGDRFEVISSDIDEDTILDTTTGLVWTRKPIMGGQRMEWEKAKQACEALAIGGHDDWRLPTIQELLTLVDYERHDPAIDTDVFECPASGWFWTSTPFASSPSGYAWLVYFYYGDAGWSNQSYGGFVRAVRVSQS